MDSSSIDIYFIFDLFLLLLIGMGPKIALVPFLELTQGMDADTQKRITAPSISPFLETWTSWPNIWTPPVWR